MEARYIESARARSSIFAAYNEQRNVDGTMRLEFPRNSLQIEGTWHKSDLTGTGAGKPLGNKHETSFGIFFNVWKKKRKEERKRRKEKEKERKDGKEKKKLFVFQCRVPLWTAYLFVLVDFLLFVEESRRYWRAIFARQWRDQLLPCFMTAREWENTR